MIFDRFRVVDKVAVVTGAGRGIVVNNVGGTYPRPLLETTVEFFEEAATPLHVIGVADDIAATVVYLVSSAGGFVTGKVIEVDGGLQTPNLELGLPDL